MDDVFLIDDRELDITKGRYVVFDDAGDLMAQSDDLDAAMAEARARGTKIPALVDLALAQERVYVF